MLKWEELQPEEEEVIIEKVSQKIVDLNIDFPAILLLGGLSPLSYMLSQFGRVYLEPWAYFFNFIPTEYLPFLEKPENLNKIIKRVNEIIDEKEKSKQSELKNKEKKSIWERILKIFRK